MNTDQRRVINRINNAQGHCFENLIERGCQYYKELGIAVIEKTPEPFRVTKKYPNGEFKGRFTANAQPDFKGTLKSGLSIVFECKETMTDRMQRNVLTQTQMDDLEHHRKMGAKAYVCVSLCNAFYMIPWQWWRDMKQHINRQYIRPADVEQYEVDFNGAVLFLNWKNAGREKE